MTRVVSYTEAGAETYEGVAAAKRAPGITWVDATGAPVEELRTVADAFDIHSLSVEDVVRDVRPKVEEFADHTFVVCKDATLTRGETTFGDELHTTQVAFFVGDDWLVTASPERVAAIDAVWEAMTLGKSRLLRFGADFVAYRVVDRIVDDYFYLLEATEETIEEIEDGILEHPDPEVLSALNDVRRELLSIRKLLWPTREAVGILARGDPDQVQEPTEKYYRDVYDHLVQLVDLTETYRDLARGAREIYLNTLSQSTNEVMKTLTVVATIILPLTFVVGIFGMNFGGSPYNMPELGWQFGYPAVMLGMALVAGTLLVYFRREDWL